MDNPETQTTLGTRENKNISTTDDPHQETGGVPRCSRGSCVQCKTGSSCFLKWVREY